MAHTNSPRTDVSTLSAACRRGFVEIEIWRKQIESNVVFFNFRITWHNYKLVKLVLWFLQGCRWPRSRGVALTLKQNTVLVNGTDCKTYFLLFILATLKYTYSSSVRYILSIFSPLYCHRTIVWRYIPSAVQRQYSYTQARSGKTTRKRFKTAESWYGRRPICGVYEAWTFNWK